MKVRIDLRLFNELQTNTDSILFIDMIKRMIKEVPAHRETCKDLIGHMALKSKQEWLQIVEHLADKCFDGKKCKNENLVKMIDKKEMHMEKVLGEDSAEWRELLAEFGKLQEHPDIKTCSSILKIFTEKVMIC